MASIFENDLILPGVITEIVPDFTSGYDASAYGSTESVTIIGTAFNGPVGQVVNISTPEYAKYVFGDSFDPKTRREATLVAEIYDAWDKGCRTIDAVRVSGKEIYKDYQLACESELKLRVRGYFPSNQNKECYMVYESTQGPVAPGTIKVYKPAYRTNMQEKMQGMAESADAILVTEIKLENYGITKSSRLVDVIDTVNSVSGNNVLVLSLVDKNGASVTSSSKQVQELSLGVVFPGIYTIGRDKAAQGVTISTEVEFVRSADKQLYNGFEEHIWKKLVLNTDVSKPYPIFGDDLSKFMLKLHGTGLIPDVKNEYLKATGAIDKIAVKDSVDYEQVELSAMELYKILGSGYAKTAKIQEIVKEDKDYQGNPIKFYKVIQTPESDANKTVGILDGVYSMLENHSTDYTILSCATAETEINGKLPRKDDFKISVANTIGLKVDGAGDPVLNMICKLDKEDMSMATHYVVNIKDSFGAPLVQEEVLGNFDQGKYLRIPAIAESAVDKEYAVDNGQLALAITKTGENEAAVYTGVLYVYNAKLKKFEAAPTGYVSDDTKLIVGMRTVDNGSELTVFKNAGANFTIDKTITGDKYFVALSNEVANVYRHSSDGVVNPVMSLRNLAEGKILDDEAILTFVEGKIPSLPCIEGTNATHVQIMTRGMSWASYGDMLEKFEQDFDLSNRFEIVLKDGSMISDDFPEVLSGADTDRKEPTYDLAKYVPYTTTDNFARHLAQHCMYTSLKTYPTHGIIGCGKLTGITLNTIAQRVDEILEQDFDLYAKKPNGNNMLNSDNMPHPIGRCLSVTFLQYPVTTGNGYNYTSNGASGYAGMVSTLAADRTSTNQPIGINGLMFELSNYQLSRLTSKGIVTCKRTTRGLVITDGVTQAPVDSAYRRLSTTKIINIIDRTLRATIEPFIGLQDNLATKNSLYTAIKSVLNKLKDSLIANYDFRIVTDPAASRLGIVKIEYKIIPVNEIREVRNTVSVTAE